MAENNIAAILINMGKNTVARKMILKTNEYFRKACH